VKNPITWFLDKVNRPNRINTTAIMNVHIKTGEKKGEAWIPCTFETMSYGIDINPSLVKILQCPHGQDAQGPSCAILSCAHRARRAVCPIQRLGGDDKKSL